MLFVGQDTFLTPSLWHEWEWVQRFDATCHFFFYWIIRLWNFCDTFYLPYYCIQWNLGMWPSWQSDHLTYQTTFLPSRFSFLTFILTTLAKWPPFGLSQKRSNYQGSTVYKNNMLAGPHFTRGSHALLLKHECPMPFSENLIQCGSGHSQHVA